MLRSWRGILILIPILMSVSAEAQTSDELKQKYALLENGSFLVRPNITLTVTFDENRQACRMEFGPQKSSISDQYFTRLMSRKVADEIINEFAPVSKRGEVLANASFNTSCSSASGTTYENVEISVASTCRPNGGGVTSARIIWRKSKCWEEYQRKPPASSQLGC